MECFLPLTLFLVLPSLASSVLATEPTKPLPLLISTEADTIIEQQMENKALKEASRKAELEAVPAIESRVIQKKDHRVTINRIAPPQLKTVPARILDEKNKSKPLTHAEFKALIAAQREHQSISLSVTVFGDEYSKILWRKPRDGEEGRQAPEEFEVWTNVNLNYLRPISTFDRDNVVYSYIGFTSTITKEDEAWRQTYAKERGYDYESRWQPSPVPFTDGKAEYVVVEGEERQMPPELYQQMDALFGHYLENEDRFKSEFKRDEALRKAREAYLKENPPEPKDVIINHWPISEGGAQ